MVHLMEDYHRISGLSDPTDADDAVTRRYVASRFQALSDEVQDKKSKLYAIQNFLRAENNRVLIRKYEVTDAVWNIGTSHNDEEGRITAYCLNVNASQMILTNLDSLIFLLLKNILYIY